MYDVTYHFEDAAACQVDCSVQALGLAEPVCIPGVPYHSM